MHNSLNLVLEMQDQVSSMVYVNINAVSMSIQHEQGMVAPIELHHSVSSGNHN